jgi:hypothetical protein
MKDAIKFASLQFGLSAVLFLMEYYFIPGAYHGEELLAIWVYIMNIGIGLAMFALFYTLFSKVIFNKFAYVMCYFLLVILITNIIPLAGGHIFYTMKLLQSLSKAGVLQVSVLFELLNPVISFIVTYLIFSRSKLWYPSEDVG